jgi:hypothetical protein
MGERKGKYASKADFIAAWNASDSVDAVATKTGMPKASCLSKASLLRRAGESLKFFRKPGGKKTNTLN